MRRPVAAVLARPKSRIFRVQSDFTTMLLGFRSCADTQHKADLEEEGAQHIGLNEELARQFYVNTASHKWPHFHKDCNTM